MKGIARIQAWRWALGLALALWGAAVWAQTVGYVVQLNGTLSVQRADGSTRILSQKSAVLLTDTLTTQKDSFAQINFTDGSSATLRPNTTMKIDQYQFNKDQPQADNISMRLLKGGLRSVTGLIGKRGNQDAYKIQTSTATLGIRGSSGDTLDCMQGCEGVTSKSGALARGVYHATHTGVYIMTTQGGSILIGPGQFGFADDPNKPPLLLGEDPGLGLDPFPFSLGSFDPAQECVVR
ncbi:MAG: FecR family protein [Burkholderiales bacterium]